MVNPHEVALWKIKEDKDPPIFRVQFHIHGAATREKAVSNGDLHICYPVYESGYSSSM